jgi:DNA polymerase (family 10)
MARTNAEIARVFARLATLLEIDGANPFRVRAYREAARVIESTAEPIRALSAEEGRLEKLSGIGKDLAQKIRDVVATGTTELYEQMCAKMPAEVAELTELQGLGPKRVKILYEKLGVRGRDDLLRAVEAGKLRELAGFGEATEKNLAKALARVQPTSERRLLLSRAWSVAMELAEHVRNVRGVEQVELAGSFRRRKETVGDLDLLATGGNASEVMDAFVAHPMVAEVLGRGETKSSVRLGNGLQVDLRAIPHESFGAAMMYFTGSKEHNIELRRIALEKGMSLNEYGLTRAEETVAARTEEDVYRALGMPWIPPELREARGEIRWALEGKLPRLVELNDLVADLHMHTDRTDGKATLEEMVRACRERGYKYCAITDHSKAIAMARGFDEARVRQSAEEIAAVRKQVPGIEVLHGLEVDILLDGSLDLDDDTLALLDWVVISIHSRLDQPGPEITERVLKAISHPAVSAMGHPTGRMIGSREPSALDMERVLARAAECGVAMEINSQPQRTDLSDVNARMAKERGVRLVIDTDAHGIPELDFLRYGVFVAQRAGLTREDVVNTYPVEQLRAQRAKKLARPNGGVTAKPSTTARPPAEKKKKPVAPAKTGTTRGKSPPPKKSVPAATRPRRG